MNLADELAYEALPSNIKMIAETYWKAKLIETLNGYNEGYSNGYKSAKRSPTKQTPTHNID